MAGVLGWSGSQSGNDTFRSGGRSDAGSARGGSDRGSSRRGFDPMMPRETAAGIADAAESVASLGFAQTAMAGRNFGAGGDFDEENDVYVPLDPCNIYETTYDLDARLADHCKFERRAMKKPPEHITMEDVQGEMDELKTEKEQDDAIKDEIKKALEALAKQTVTNANMKDRALTAARICQIENRLQTDPSLCFDDEVDGGKGMVTDEAARLVKRSLIRTYGKIKKSSHDLSLVAQHQLDNRIQILKKV